MRTLLTVAGLALLTASLVVIGFFAGSHYGSQTRTFEESVLHEQIAEAAATQKLVTLLHEGKIADATNTLNHRLDGLVISIGTLLPHCPNQETRAFAGNVLSDVARHRAAAPVSRTNAFIDEKVKEILEGPAAAPSRE